MTQFTLHNDIILSYKNIDFKTFLNFYKKLLDIAEKKDIINNAVCQQN